MKTNEKFAKNMKLTKRPNYILNRDKTEIMTISTRQGLQAFKEEPVSVAGTLVQPVSHVKNLGAFFNATLNMETFVAHTCKVAFCQLRNIARIRPYLDMPTTEKVIHAFVSSRVDYCNSLLLGAPISLIQKMQRVQNMAARVVTQTQKYDHISPALVKLHWLPIQNRIQYKVLLMVYKCLHNAAPVYLSSLLSHYVPSRSLRSADKSLLSVPKSKLRSFGDNAFYCFAPKMWNALPCNVRSAGSLTEFKSELKTYLFKKSYG